MNVNQQQPETTGGLMAPEWTLDFAEIGISDVGKVGGKNASLGQMFNTLREEGVSVLDGFATTAAAYRLLLGEFGLRERLENLLAGLDIEDVPQLRRVGEAARDAVLSTPLPAEIRAAVTGAWERLCQRLGREPELAVRSSATAEDLPDASFAGQQETFLNIRGREGLLQAVHACYASLFTDRAISYRAKRGYDHMAVALSVGVQPMVRSDVGSAGVIFTLDTESGFRDVVYVTGSYGLGEYVVQGVVTPDEWVVFKPTLAEGKRPIVSREMGSKEVRLVYAGGARATRSEAVPETDRRRFCLLDDDVLQLARWACTIEAHYSKVLGRPQPMDIEWAKDGISGELFILQARPETVHSSKAQEATVPVYRLTGKPGEVLAKGQAVGDRIGSGTVRVVRSASQLAAVRPGDVLVTKMTDPDWEPVMKRLAAIVTDQGGRTAHAAIVSRELGLPCIVGAGNASQVLQDGQDVTVCCSEGSEGHVYAGLVPFEKKEVSVSAAATRTHVMLNVADPAQAFRLAAIPNAGVGLARIEFVITNSIGVHPMALVRYPKLADAAATAKIERLLAGEEPREYFISRLAEGVGRIAAAFYPKPVIVRTSDFKTNEYAQLLGGAEFEPAEENPMLGFRGASRYHDPRYAEGFALECQALRRVREEMGLTNVKVMIPFCRTVREAEQVLQVMAGNGLRQGDNGLEVYAMCEIPANVVLADEFLQLFDGYSIGSNDLTQLVLGIDRDSGTIAHLFDERNGAVKAMIRNAVEAAHRAGKPIGICGQAPSDYPDFAAWLVSIGITSISLNPDTAIRTAAVIAEAESRP
jgi:pyruvate, water dikinase